MRLRVLGCLLGCVLSSACVEGAKKPALGEVRFNSVTKLSSNDYVGAVGIKPSAAGSAAPNGASGAPSPNEQASGGASSIAAPPGASGTSPVTAGTSAGFAARGASGSAPGSAGGSVGGSAAGSAATGTAGTPVVGSSGGSLTIDFTSVNQGGTYAPRNVGAVWIETGSSKFVRTLERWGTIRATHLTRWTAASGGWSSFFGIGATEDELDAMSRATLASHQAHHLSWDLKDLMKQVMPDGKYNVVIEVTEDNARPGASAVIGFDKGPAPMTVKPPDAAPFKGLSLDYKP